MSADPEQIVSQIAQRARAAALALATMPVDAKNDALLRLADLIDGARDTLLAANAKDLADARQNGLQPAQIERLTLTTARLDHLALSVREVAALPDPVGELLEQTTRPNGLILRKVRVPIGVIGIVYEARPNVTVDCAILCLKSGNAAILRGGKESFHTNMALARIIGAAVSLAGLPPDCVQLIPTTDRAALLAMLQQERTIQCIIPRGGEGLIRFVTENSRIPVIKHYTGVCFVYVDRAADPVMAERIVVNSKVQRPGVCNALEQLLIHGAVARTVLPTLARALVAKGVRLRVDAASASLLKAESIPHEAASPGDFTAEFLDLVLAIRIVGSIDEAIAIINRDGSGHSDAIVTAEAAAAAHFQACVDSAAVLWNASTRFNDGFEFGLGAEIGISTDRLHARGPMGLRELCSYKWLVTGSGQIRE